MSKTDLKVVEDGEQSATPMQEPQEPTDDFTEDQEEGKPLHNLGRGRNNVEGVPGRRR
jgi:hypothetical protein